MNSTHMIVYPNLAPCPFCHPTCPWCGSPLPTPWMRPWYWEPPVLVPLTDWTNGTAGSNHTFSSTGY